MPKLTSIAISSAMPEVTSVPMMGISAPNLSLTGSPVGTGQETEAKSMHGRQAAHQQRDYDRCQQRQHTECGDSRQTAEQQVEHCLSFMSRFA